MADNGAEFSPCGKYRYTLWRIWDQAKPLVMFIGLNPSTANAETDDPTIRRVKRFANDWGYGGVHMANLFAYVTAYPEELMKCSDPVGDNDSWLSKIDDKCRRTVFAWGSFEVSGRDKKVIRMFPNGMALVINKDGTPRHPLYVPATTTPVLFLSDNEDSTPALGVIA